MEATSLFGRPRKRYVPPNPGYPERVRRMAVGFPLTVLLAVRLILVGAVMLVVTPVMVPTSLLLPWHAAVAMNDVVETVLTCLDPR